jgi:histidyl-tRNA synthetase
MSSKYQIVKGFRDVLPPESALFWSAEKSAREIFACFGYQEIMLPVVEYLELFTRSIGDSTDIVEKEMFIIPDQKDRNLALRPEATASAVRAYIEGLAGKGPQKLFYFGPMFRHERPQKGRYRQFWQIGAEAIGYPGPATDAELLKLLEQYFKSFGLSEIELKLNSLGCAKCRPVYRQNLVEYLKASQSKLCQDCKRRLAQNPLRVLDCKHQDCRTIAQTAPSPLGALCPECSEHFDRLRVYLEMCKLSYTLDPHLVRGLDYYTRTVFEFQARTGLGAQNAVAAGGRYDDLISEMGGPATPAIGFALGVERLLILLEEKIPRETLINRPDIFMVAVGDQAYKFAFKLLFDLRRAGLYAEMAVDEPSRSLRSQLKLADKTRSRLAMIVGDDELKSRSLNVKILESGKELKLDNNSLKTMAGVDWEEMKMHLNSAGFAFVSRDYEKMLIENQNLFKVLKIYLDALENQEG